MILPKKEALGRSGSLRRPTRRAARTLRTPVTAPVDLRFSFVKEG